MSTIFNEWLICLIIWGWTYLKTKEKGLFKFELFSWWYVILLQVCAAWYEEKKRNTINNKALCIISI